MLGAVRRWMRGMEAAFLKRGVFRESQSLSPAVSIVRGAGGGGAGLHLLFGASLTGAVMPRDPELVAYLVEKFESITVLLLLPLFFACTGLRTDVGRLGGTQMWALCAFLIMVAVAGKIGGTGIGAGLGGLGWRESMTLGALMNTRGLMVLVILNIGLEIRAMSPPLFPMMAVMAIVTTAMT